ncbi:MAG: 50S ribosomal protein L9 [Verrucomicrobia bacterium]|nr:50S ribosomal protein L9 [Verrucomicrobiota bacterium]
MPKTEVILTSNIVGLGAESDQVKVNAGYARNYLFPQRLAVPVSGVNKRRLESLRQRRAEREAHELNTMMELAKSISKLIAVIQVKTGEDGKMFGSVTSGTIADTLKTQFDIMLDKKKIHLEKPIHAVGEYEVELHLHHDVNTSMKVRVESLNPPPKLEEQPGVEGGRPGRVTEKRGRRFEREGKPEAGSEAGPADAKPEKPVRAPKAEKAPKAQK